MFLALAVPLRLLDPAAPCFHVGQFLSTSASRPRRRGPGAEQQLRSRVRDLLAPRGSLRHPPAVSPRLGLAEVGSAWRGATSHRRRLNFPVLRRRLTFAEDLAGRCEFHVVGSGVRARHPPLLLPQTLRTSRARFVPQTPFCPQAVVTLPSSLGCARGGSLLGQRWASAGSERAAVGAVS